MGFVSAQPTITVGGQTFYDRTNLIILTGFAGSNGSSSFKKTNVGSGGGSYQVPASKTFTVWALRLEINSVTAAIALFDLLYADNAIGYNSATAFTTPIYMGGGTTFLGHMKVTDGANTQEAGENEYVLDFQVPTTKYLSCTQSGTTAILAKVYGYET